MRCFLSLKAFENYEAGLRPKTFLDLDLNLTLGIRSDLFRP
jgi:hypothetical protein